MFTTKLHRTPCCSCREGLYKLYIEIEAFGTSSNQSSLNSIRSDGEDFKKYIKLGRDYELV